MNGRSLLSGKTCYCLLLVASATLSQAGEPTLAKSSKAAAQLFPLSEVRLLPGPFTAAVEANRKYLLALDCDRLLAPFLREAGLTPKAPPYGSWESGGLDGHIGGHYLAALANMIAAGDDGDGELRRRLDYMVDQLEIVQKANGDGYIGGVPGSKKFWADLAAGKIDSSGSRLNGKWVPFYNLHKTFAGLRDAYLVAGNRKARELMIRFGDWCDKLTAGLSDEQMQSILKTEHGGMYEVLGDIYALTGDEKYLRVAERFHDRSILDPLTAHEDQLTGKHANTQIPKVIGLERVSALTGDAKGDSGAEFFWEDVTGLRSVAFGGNSVGEHFNDPKDFRHMLEDREGPETCNSYNMLRLTEQLFERHPQPVYADFYERTLFNHLLSAINPTHPGYVYFTPIRPAHYRVYSQPGEGFWCCVGTGMENPGKYGQFIYAHDKDGLYVNLFMASTLDEPGTGMKVTQNTAFPDEERTRLTIQLKQPKTFTLYLRHPKWVAENAFAVRVNGQPAPAKTSPSSYATVRREWKDGDKVEIDLPMQTDLERLPDNSPWYAILHGPIVLASPDGTQDLDGLYASAKYGAHDARGPYVPLDKSPILVTTPAELPKHVVPDPDKKPLHFRLVDVANPPADGGLPLVPFYNLHESRYQMYWEVTTPDALAKHREQLAAEDKKRQERESITLDSVAVGEQQPEVEHGFVSQNSSSDYSHERHYRRGRSFQYTLNPHGEKAVDLAFTYWGGDQWFVFDVLVNDQPVATVKLTGQPKDFVEKICPIPEAVLANAKNGQVVVKFVGQDKSNAGNIYDVRLLRRGPVPAAHS